MKCKDCFYRVPVKQYTSDKWNKEICISYDAEGSEYAECHRYPPTHIKTEVQGVAVDYFGWPPIMWYEKFDPWCGEFKPNKEAEEKQDKTS